MKLTSLLSLVFSMLMLVSMMPTITDATLSSGTEAQSKPQSFLTTVSWNEYHNYTQMVNILLNLNASYQALVDLFSIGESWQNRAIYGIKLTNESATYPKSQIFFVGYHHARERITVELALYLAVYIASNAGTNQTLANILNKSEIYIVPALNVDGFEAVVQNHWQRKNARPTDEDSDGSIDEDPAEDADGDGRVEYLWNAQSGFVRWEGPDNDMDGLYGEDWVGGVDLNRNYGYAWDAPADSGSTNPQDEDYKGPAPFSELETQALRAFVLQHDFKYAVSFHSGAEVILYPWGYTTLPSLDDQMFRSLAANMSLLTGAPYQQAGAMYTTSGVWDDWMYGNQSIKTFTFEIFTNNSAWTYEPGPEPGTYWVGGITGLFNPLPTSILATIDRWMPAPFYLINKALEEFQYTLLGDVNGDAIVDIYDLILVGTAFGSNPGNASWNPNADLVKDNVIDIFDIIIVASNFGKTIFGQTSFPFKIEETQPHDSAH